MNKYFDERQLKIRGEVFFHGLIAALALLLINALLNALDIVWASGFHQNIVMLGIVVMVVIIEAILRDVFFGMGQLTWPIIGAYVVGAAVFIYSFVTSFMLGNTLVYDGMLTNHGLMGLVMIMYAFIAVAGLVKVIIEKLINHE